MARLPVGKSISKAGAEPTPGVHQPSAKKAGLLHMQRPFTNISYWSYAPSLGLEYKVPATPQEALWIPTFQMGQRVNIFGFVSLLCHNYSIAIVSAKAALDNMQSNGHGCVPIKLYSPKQVAGWI